MTDGMKYEKTGNKKPNGKEIALKQLEQVSTSKLILFIVKRHRVGLLSTWAIIITILYMFPPLPDIILSLI